jgi:hypothetical protein
MMDLVLPHWVCKQWRGQCGEMKRPFRTLATVNGSKLVLARPTFDFGPSKRNSTLVEKQLVIDRWQGQN